MLHVGVVQVATAGLHGGYHFLGLGRDNFCGLVGHQASDGQFDTGKFFAVADDDNAAADFA